MWPNELRFWLLLLGFFTAQLALAFVVGGFCYAGQWVEASDRFKPRTDWLHKMRREYWHNCWRGSQELAWRYFLAVGLSGFVHFEISIMKADREAPSKAFGPVVLLWLVAAGTLVATVHYLVDEWLFIRPLHYQHVGMLLREIAERRALTRDATGPAPREAPGQERPEPNAAAAKPEPEPVLRKPEVSLATRASAAFVGDDVAERKTQDSSSYDKSKYKKEAPVSAKAEAQRKVRREFGVMGWSVAGCAAVAVGAYYMVGVFLLPERQLFFRWVFGILSVLGAGWIFVMFLDRRKQILSEAEKKDEQSYNGRTQLREATRRFAGFLDDQYGWVVKMDQLHQELQALVWYDDIVLNWRKENAEWQELRKSDDRDIIAYELADDADRMFAIWERRQKLYHFAVAYSTEDQRAAKILETKRKIEQNKIEEEVKAEEFKREKLGSSLIPPKRK